VKFRGATLVDFAKLDEILNALPPPKIKAPPKSKRST